VKGVPAGGRALTCARRRRLNPGMRTIRGDERCAQARALISEELDGELSEFGRAALLAHVRSCSECAEFAASLGEAARLLRGAPLAQPSRVVSVGGAAARAGRGRSTRRIRMDVAAPSIAAAAAVAVAVFAFAGGTRTPPATLFRAAAPHTPATATQEPSFEQNLLVALGRIPLRGGRMRFM
jgi:predicted anti-sigma-YlaC factor YlaD